MLEKDFGDRILLPGGSHSHSTALQHNMYESDDELII